MNTFSDTKIGVIGLGYVGLPLTLAFSKKFLTYGYDLDKKRIKDLNKGIDSTYEVSNSELKVSSAILTEKIDELKNCNVYIVTVPTPIDISKQPDLRPLMSASRDVGKILSKGDIVVFESTVYPGATEEVCVPILESNSRLKFNEDFFCGYSPERINPGDKKHRIDNIIKVTSGSNDYAAKIVNNLYLQIIKAGTHLAPSIKVAEAAKVIENTQRDLNVALMNELSIIFSKLNISTKDVLLAANTKWNFLEFYPGLVGGHCIGVDPYYLTHKAKMLGYHPEVILSGRRVNDYMSKHVSNICLREVIKRKKTKKTLNALIMGLTFKENCPDIRNTKIIDIYQDFIGVGISTDIFDPVANHTEVKKEYGVDLLLEIKSDFYDIIIIAVAHDVFLKLGFNAIKSFGVTDSIIFDIKSIFPNQNETLTL